jgi:hypothetical protein
MTLINCIGLENEFFFFFFMCPFLFYFFVSLLYCESYEMYVYIFQIMNKVVAQVSFCLIYRYVFRV